ncbi:PAS domain S-box-containing protein [Parabacteroides sp. PFB2-10]|uniref:PAS domain-containing sensor histidine kinase n=1 Tax=Parabacteroides sp. PFB2-10 TaxID=1742405 RepID=UPI00247377BD|nr:ATP-binding protein [Parabacteroides sp. PFB2-10]MDH6311966.1 PAS domain S-box-containing protein [Parabacteroides sp. PFB2-10]
MITFIQEHPFFSLFCLLLILTLGYVGYTFHRYRRRQREDMQTANSWMSQLLGSIPDTAIIYDSDLRIVNIINPQKNFLFQADIEQYIGLSVFDMARINLSLQNAAEVISEYVVKTAGTGESFVFEYAIVRGDETFYFEATTVPFVNDYVICFTHDETQHIIARKEVNRLKDFFQSIVDNLPVGLLVKEITNEFRFVFFNHHLLDFFGDKVVFELGKNELESDDPRAPIYYAEDEKVVAGGEPVSFERVSLNPDTGLPERWEVTTKSCFTNADGKEYLMAVTVETTDIQKREFELGKTKDALSLALEAGNVSAWYYDFGLRQFMTLYGQTLSQEGKSFDEILAMLHPDDVPQYRRMMERFSSGESEKGKYIYRFRTEEGNWEWYETYIISQKAEKEGLPPRVIGTEKNITEEILKQKELIDAKSKLELALSSSRIIPWEYDLQADYITSVNPQAFEFPGYTFDGIRQFIHPDDWGALDEAVERLINGKEKIVHFEMRLVGEKEEELRWFAYTASVTGRDVNGHVSAITGVRRDVTNVKMTDELIELRDKAERSNRMKSAFLANMSHEIRTPLNAIVGFSQLMMQAEDRQEQENYYEIIEANNELLLQLISDILDISKIEANELDFIYSGFEVASLFHTLEKVYVDKVKEGVSLITTLPERLCLIYSDKNRLTQVVSNFISNAIKFTTQGSITMGFDYVEGGLRFFVRDTGKGIDSEHRERVFDRFSKFDSFIQGNGLGLSICQSIVEHLGGEIGVSSELGKGSEFWFIIPCEPVLL